MRIRTNQNSAHFDTPAVHSESRSPIAVISTLSLLSVFLFAACDRGGAGADEAADENVAAEETEAQLDDRQAIPPFEGTVPRLLRFEGEAGYDEPSMSAFGDACIAGQVPKDPQHTFQVEETTAMEFLAQGEDDDLSLVIDGPGGPYCNDDYDGLDAGMQLELEPGEYSVYIGTYSDEPLDPTPAYTFVIRDTEGAEPRNPVLSLLDTRLDELIQTAEPTQREQLERLQVMLSGLGHPRGRSIEVQSVDELKRMLNGLNLSEAEKTEVNALIERLESEAEPAATAAPDSNGETPGQ